MPRQEPSSSPGGNNPPPIPDDDQENKFIGVPDDYFIAGPPGPRPGHHSSYNDPTYADQNLYPIYHVGSEYIPANYPSDQIWQLQQAMAQVGLLTTNFTRHVWDPPTMSAYRSLLGIANAQGLKVDEALSQLLATAGSEEGLKYKVDENGNVIPVNGASEIAPLVVRTTDPAALRQTFRKAIIETLGEGWSTAEINKMVIAYNQIERSAQQREYDLMNGGGGNVTVPPTPEQFIEAQAIKRDPIGAQTEQALDFTQEFMNAANAPAWGVG